MMNINQSKISQEYNVDNSLKKSSIMTKEQIKSYSKQIEDQLNSIYKIFLDGKFYRSFSSTNTDSAVSYIQSLSDSFVKLGLIFIEIGIIDNTNLNIERSVALNLKLLCVLFWISYAAYVFLCIYSCFEIWLNSDFFFCFLRSLLLRLIFLNICLVVLQFAILFICFNVSKEEALVNNDHLITSMGESVFSDSPENEDDIEERILEFIRLNVSKDEALVNNDHLITSMGESVFSDSPENEDDIEERISRALEEESLDDSFDL